MIRVVLSLLLFITYGVIQAQTEELYSDPERVAVGDKAPNFKGIDL
ncbi:MAG: hypothetical protein ACI959_000203 [Limisphaerales bacterium]|jgi:hypothetical protein